MKKLLVFTLVAAFAGFAWLSLPGPDQARTLGASQKTTSGSGLVQSIDKERGVVTIKHGPLPALLLQLDHEGRDVEGGGDLLREPHREVLQDERDVGLLPARLLQPRRPIARGGDLPASGEFQRELDQLPKIGVVVNEQHAERCVHGQ